MDLFLLADDRQRAVRLAGESAAARPSRDPIEPPQVAGLRCDPISMAATQHREGRAVPRAPRGRAVRHPEPVGRRLGEGARGARLPGARDARAPASRSRSAATTAASRSTRWSSTRARSPRRSSCRSRWTSRTATARSPRTRRGRSSARPRRAPSAARSRTTTPTGDRIYDLGHAAERVTAAVEAARAARLPVHADRAGREPHPRQPRPRRHDRAPPGVRARGRGRAVRARPAHGRRDQSACARRRRSR